MQPVCLLMIFLLFTLIFSHNLIKDILIDLIERTFNREGSPYLACNNRNAFHTSENPKKYHEWSCQNVCDALTFLLDNIFIPSCIDKYLGFLWALIVLPWLQIYACFFMKGTF